MEWLTEAIDQNSRPLPDAVATLVKEIQDVELSRSKTVALRSILRNVRSSLDDALKILDSGEMVTEVPLTEFKTVTFAPKTDDGSVVQANPGDDRMVEGVFDGMGMVGDDGKSYIVPPNYASKSKLVEGDMLKLTIGTRGNFIYKQIGPIERNRVIGTLAYDQETGQYMVVAGGRSWNVLKASITYFKAEAGDEAIILTPKNAPSKWAAVENIIKKGSSHNLTF